MFLSMRKAVGEEIIMGDIELDDTTIPVNATHIEDGLYRCTNTEVVYDHYDMDYKCDNIRSIIGTEFNPVSGKLMALVSWEDDQQSHVEAEMIKQDDPMKLAKHIIDNPAE
jgi:hypothetical protein